MPDGDQVVGGKTLEVLKVAYGYKGLEGGYKQNQCNIP